MEFRFLEFLFAYYFLLYSVYKQQRNSKDKAESSMNSVEFQEKSDNKKPNTPELHYVQGPTKSLLHQCK